MARVADSVASGTDPRTMKVGALMKSMAFGRVRRGLVVGVTAVVVAGVAAVASTASPAGAIVVAPQVGYYEMCDSQGRANQANPITAAGANPVSLADMTAAQLAGKTAAFVDNCDNSGYGAEYL